MDQEKRVRIIKSAMKQFNEHGFHAMPTSKIAKAAGVSVGTLFNYFPHKEDLIQAIYKEIKTHSKDEFLSHLDNTSTGYELFKKMWHAFIKWGLENPDEFRYMSLYTHSPFKKQHNEVELTDSYSRLKETLKKVVKPTAVCAHYPEFTMIYLNNALQATIEFLLKNNIEDEDHFIDASLDLFWNGFSA